MKKEFKKRNAIILGIILMMIAGLGSVFALNNKRSNAKNETFKTDMDYVYVFDEEPDTYYLKRIDNSQRFEIKAETPSFKIVTEQGESLDVKAHDKGDGLFEILPPEEGYQKGQEYNIILGEGNEFTDENYKDAQELIIAIERDNVEEYVLQDNVILSEETVDVIDENTIKTDVALSVDEIILGEPDDVEPYAYKITKVNADNSYEVKEPYFDEIYQDLNVYGEYKLDFEPKDFGDIKVAMEEEIKKSDWFKNIIVSAEANPLETSVETKFEVVDGITSIKIEITLVPCGDALFQNSINQNTKLAGFFEAHDVELTFGLEFEPSLLIDIKNLNDMDFGFGSKLQADFSVGFTKKEAHAKKEEYDWFEANEFVRSVLNVEDNEITYDFIYKIIDGRQYITAVPGLYLKYEMGPGLSFEGEIDLTLNTSATHYLNAGLKIKDKKPKTYANYRHDDPTLDLSVEGNLYLAGGMFGNLKVVFISDKLGNIKIDTSAGLDAYGIGEGAIGEDGVEASLYADIGAFAKVKTGAKVAYKKLGIELLEFTFYVRKTIDEIGVDLLPRSVKIDEDKGYLEIETLRNEPSVQDIFGLSLGFPYEFFPSELSTKEDPHHSERIKINIDSKDARTTEEDYNDYLDAVLKTNRESGFGTNNAFGFVSIIDTYEDDDVFSMAWVEGFFVPYSDFMGHSINYASFDLKTGKLLSPQDVLNQNKYKDIKNTIIAGAEALAGLDTINYSYPSVVEYVDTVFEYPDFTRDDIKEKNKLYAYLSTDYPIMVKDKEIYYRYEIRFLENFSGEARVYGETKYIKD